MPVPGALRLGNTKGEAKSTVSCSPFDVIAKGSETESIWLIVEETVMVRSEVETVFNTWFAHRLLANSKCLL